MRSVWHSFRNHIITGFIFLMPLLVIIAVIGKFWNQALTIGGKLSKLLLLDTVLGKAGDAIMAILLFVILCAVAGILVRISLFKRLSESVDNQLAKYIPQYREVRRSALSKVGRAETAAPPVYSTCLVMENGLGRPAYIIDELEDGGAVVYVPEPPTLTQGQVYTLPAGAWQRLPYTSIELDARLRKLGKDLLNTA
jgi:uncharacterized membrane protein